MNKKLFFIFFISTLLISYIIVYASGGGGGGGGCGKNNPNCNGGGGGGGGGNPNLWIYTTIDNDITPFRYTGPPIEDMTISCGFAPGPNNTEYRFPLYGGQNTFPVLIPQVLGSNDFLAQIVVENLATGERKYQEAYIGSSTSPLLVPKLSAFRLSVVFVSRCSQCMSPSIITLAANEGKRVNWSGIVEYPGGSSNGREYGVAAPYMYYAGLSSCN